MQFQGAGKLAPLPAANQAHPCSRLVEAPGAVPTAFPHSPFWLSTFIRARRDGMILAEKLSQIEVLLTTGLLRAFGGGRVVGHGLDADATGAGKAVEDDRGAGHQTADGAKDAAAALRTGNRRDRHLHRGVFPQPGARLDVQRLARGQHLLEDVAVAVQQHHSLPAARRELVDEQARAAEQDVGRALHKGEAVVDVAGSDKELVFAHLNHLPRLQAQGDDLSHGVAGEGNVAGSLGFRNEDLQTGEEAFSRALNRFEADLHARMLPQQDVMFEVDGELVAQHDIDHRHEFAINRDGHIGNAQGAFGVMQLCAGDGAPKHAIPVFLVLIGWNISTIGCYTSLLWRWSIGARWLSLWRWSVRAGWLSLWRWSVRAGCLRRRRLPRWHWRATDAAEFHAVGHLVMAIWTNHDADLPSWLLF